MELQGVPWGHGGPIGPYRVLGFLWGHWGFPWGHGGPTGFLRVMGGLLYPIGSYRFLGFLWGYGGFPLVMRVPWVSLGSWGSYMVLQGPIGFRVSYGVRGGSLGFVGVL